MPTGAEELTGKVNVDWIPWLTKPVELGIMSKSELGAPTVDDAATLVSGIDSRMKGADKTTLAGGG